MDSYKLGILEQSLNAAMQEFMENCRFNYLCEPEMDLKEHIHDDAKQAFYALGQFRDAIITALKD